MNINTACDILILIISSLGILIGFLLIFLQFVPDRKRRIHDILTAKHFEILIDKTTNLNNQDKKKKEESAISITRRKINDMDIKLNIFNNFSSSD
jgi:uncharacterized membrane protein YgaE (UPF0421/DUF939 family)